MTSASDAIASLTPRDMPEGHELDGDRGKAACHAPKNASPRDLLIRAGVDPDLWQISGKVNARNWNVNAGRARGNVTELFYYFKFDIVAGESPEAKKLHVDDLVKRIRKRSQSTRKIAAGTDVCDMRTFVFVVSDWQIGKAEGGFGTDETVRRFKDSLAQAVQQVNMLRRAGVPLNHLAILSVGDLVEGCGDHYAMQTFSIDLDRRSQCRTVREMLTEAILTLAPMFESTDIAAVGGNHGENRKDGKAYTTFADNDDLATIEAVREAFDLAGWENLVWTIPNEELSIVVEVGGVKIGLAHGHQFRGGANAQKKAEDWWRSQDFGLQAVREAQILLTGHFHHLCVVNIAGRRTWIQAPTIDPGSQWYTGTSGVTAIPGILTFVVDADNPVGYDHLRMLVPSKAQPS
jgi:predicted phosphodiesterase